MTVEIVLDLADEPLARIGENPQMLREPDGRRLSDAFRQVLRPRNKRWLGLPIAAAEKERDQ